MEPMELPQFILPPWELAFYDADGNEIGERLPTNGGQWLMDPDGTLHDGVELVFPTSAVSVVLYGHDDLTWTGVAALPLTLRMS